MHHYYKLVLQPLLLTTLFNSVLTANAVLNLASIIKLIDYFLPTGAPDAMLPRKTYN